MLLYPKIETLYDRGDDFTVDPTKLRMKEFVNVRQWRVTEKIDGTNIRIGLKPDGTIWYNGRTDNAQMPGSLVKLLTTRFPQDVIKAAFDEGTEAVIFGEGYGPGIQKGGGSYSPSVGFRVFDVAVQGADRLYWLEPEAMAEVADKIGARIAPFLGWITDLPRTVGDLAAFFEIADELISMVGTQDGGNLSRPPEGIVATADPQLYTRYGTRVAWKLKFSDYRQGKK